MYIRKIQQLLDHKEVATMVIHTHVLNSVGKGVLNRVDSGLDVSA